MKTIIERGASWTLEETKMLLALWGQDLVQRQATNTKRTKEVYEKISEKFNQNGYERTADQVRTRVFNMIAEYRRILKDPNPERMKKCIFFEALHKIYQAKHMDDVKSALDDYEPEYPYSPASNNILSEKGDESVSDFEAAQNQTSSNLDGNDTVGNSNNNNNNLYNSGSNNSASSANAAAAHSGTHANNNVNNSNSNNYSSINKQDHTGGDSNTIGNSNTSDNNNQPQGAGSKRIKLESPKSDKNNKQSSSDMASNSDNVIAPSSSSKQANKSSSNAGGGAQSASALNDKTSSSSTLMSSPSTSSSSVSQRHQSLLLPHVSAAASSSGAAPTAPINKLAATSAGNTTPSYININSTKLPIIRTNQLIGHSNGTDANGQSTANRLPTTATISHQLYQAPVNTFDVTSSALLIDRMFAHLSRESENMREWIALEKERLALERARRQQEAERESRRERVLIDTLMRFQEQWLSFLSRLDPRIVENATETPPELKIPPKESSSAAAASNASAPTSIATATTTTNTTTTTTTSMSSNEASQQNAPQESQHTTNQSRGSSGNSSLIIDISTSSSQTSSEAKQ